MFKKIKFIIIALSVLLTLVSCSSGSSTEADIISPDVSFVDLGTHEFIWGIVIVRVNATDNIEVESVDLFIDGVSVLNQVNAPFDLLFDCSTLDDGFHAFQAIATDPTGNSGLSAIISIQTYGIEPDFEAPVVNITALNNGDVIWGTEIIEILAFDNNEVTLVELLIDGVSMCELDTSPYYFTLECSTLSDGSHTFKAIARDAWDNVGESNELNVNTYAEQPDIEVPVVSFVNLNNNDDLSGICTITVNATDNVDVASVQLLVNDQIIDEDYLSPFSFSFNCNDYDDGMQTFQAKAYDAVGNMGETNTVMANTEYDFAPNNNGRIKVSITNYQELDSFDLTGYGDPYFVYILEIDDVEFDTYTSVVFPNDNSLAGPISHTFDIPDNVREYKITVRVWDDDTSDDDQIDYTAANGYSYYWMMTPVDDDFIETYNGEDDGISSDKDCQITLQVETMD